MKISIWLGLLIAILDISIFFYPAECFTIPVSVSTGMAIIIALVKIKAIFVKVLLGLKAMGVDGFVWRRRRDTDAIKMSHNLIISSTPLPPHLASTLSLLPTQQEELMEAWHDLQQTVGKVIDFDLESCTNASETTSRSDEDLPWDLISSKETSESNNSNKSNGSINYSRWVSKILGSMIGDPIACQVLNEELHKSASPSSTFTTAVTTQSSLPVDTTKGGHKSDNVNKLSTKSVS